jgi:Raf kinase inhibitor-like YbhB/YbcL family protein
MNRYHVSPALRAATAVAIAAATLTAGPLSAQNWDDDQGSMELTSSAFTNGGPLPAANIYNILATGTTYNVCSATGAGGGDQSPPLAWRHVPSGTRSFVVVLYDTTASFTHWGMYNIPANVRALPANAGAPGSQYGSQVLNDFFDQSYDGPCPPAGVAPEVHHYVFTVYALDRVLSLGSANFPPFGESVYQALIKAGRGGHILASAELVALNSGSAPP